MSDPDWRALNRANWDERVAIHLNAPNAYDLTPLRGRTARLGPIADAVLGPVDSQHVLHLQCHFGVDTLTMAQQGATVVGLDFSAEAIAAARTLTDELGLTDRARFVEADLYDAASALPEPACFDRVFVSWGALCWLPDMVGWARIVAHFLKPGGYLALAEAHPFAYVFDGSKPTADGMPGWSDPYFARRPMAFDNAQDYADPNAVLTNTRTVEWLHPISDVITALLDAGLRLDRLQEHDSVPWKLYDPLIEDAAEGFRWPDRPWLPLSYSLRAAKPDV